MNHTNIKKQIETWREQRAEKLMARLSRQASMSIPSNRLSPSILGIKAVSSTSQSNGKQAVVKQRPHKKEPIEVRQTKSSSLRFHLANPLLDIHSMEHSKMQSLLITRPGDVTNDKEFEKRYTFAVPQKSVVIEQNKTPASKLSVNHARGKLNESFKIPDLNHKKNLDIVTHASSKLSGGMKANQIDFVNNKQTDRMSRIENGKHINVNSSKERSVYKSNKRRETFSIGSSYNETVRKTELQHFEENYCNKLDFNEAEVSELLSSTIIQTEHCHKLNETVQNIENISVEHIKTDMKSETNKRRETFNIDLMCTNNYNTEASVSNTTDTIPDLFSARQKQTQNEVSNVNKPHVLRKSVCPNSVKNSPSYQNLSLKRNSKSLSTVNKLMKSNTESREHYLHQRQTTTLTNTSLPRKPEKVTALQRALTYSHINGNKSLPAKRRQSFIIGRKHDIFSKKMVSPISEEGSVLTEESLLMSSPKLNQNCNSIASISSVKSTPYQDTLKRNLQQWLTKRSKSVNGYRHLQCFLDCKKAVPVRTPLSNKKEVNCAKNTHTNVQMPVEADCYSNDEDKENMGSPNKNKPADTNDTVIVQQTRDALTDLRRLILEDYDHDECERWMQALHSQNHSITEFVEYWECVAALEETRGDIKMAVDSYQRAIIRGAEVESVNEHINRLFDKMVLLNINPMTTKPQKQTRTYVDPKNIFSSTVIRFALQQKAVKKLANELEVDENQLHYLATPVRRTTRLHHKTNSNCVRSLSELEPEIKNHTNFKPNPAFS